MMGKLETERVKNGADTSSSKEKIGEAREFYYLEPVLSQVLPDRLGIRIHKVAAGTNYLIEDKYRIFYIQGLPDDSLAARALLLLLYRDDIVDPRDAAALYVKTVPSDPASGTIIDTQLTAQDGILVTAEIDKVQKTVAQVTDKTLSLPYTLNLTVENRWLSEPHVLQILSYEIGISKKAAEFIKQLEELQAKNPDAFYSLNDSAFEIYEEISLAISEYSRTYKCILSPAFFFIVRESEVDGKTVTTIRLNPKLIKHDINPSSTMLEN